MTAFDKWLKTLAASGKGSPTLYCDRGVPFTKHIALQADYTGATVRGEVRLRPDSPSALGTFTVSALSVVSGVSSFSISLSEAVVNELPEDPTGEGLVDLVSDLLITPSGGSEQRLFGGCFTVIGQVTA